MNCKQGDLAFIIKSASPENIGKIVEVVRPYVEGEEFPSIDGSTIGRLLPSAMKRDRGYIWVVRSHGAPLLWASLINTNKGLFRERAFGDYCLRPIPRLDEPEEITTDKELTV